MNLETMLGLMRASSPLLVFLSEKTSPIVITTGSQLPSRVRYPVLQAYDSVVIQGRS